MEEIWKRFSKAFLEQDRWRLYLEGLGNTIIIALVAALIGTLIGVVFAMVNYIHKKNGRLKILSAIGTLFYDGRLKAAFLAASDTKSCMEILARAEV